MARQGEEVTTEEKTYEKPKYPNKKCKHSYHMTLEKYLECMDPVNIEPAKFPLTIAVKSGEAADEEPS